MARPISTTEVLQSILDYIDDFTESTQDFEIEQEARWFKKLTQDDPNGLESGEAQANIRVGGRLYAITLEKLP